MDALVGSNGTAVDARLGASDPQPLMLLQRGPVSDRALRALFRDPRIELVPVADLSVQSISLANRLAGLLVATAKDPLESLLYVISAGITVPVVLAMPSEANEQGKDLRLAGAAALIVMPIWRSDISRIVKLLSVQHSSVRVDVTLRILLDPIEHVVHYRDSSTKLTQREFSLLHFLTEHRGRAVATNDLFNAVWGLDAAGHNARETVAVYVCQLRVKLATIGLERAIRTIRGFGYAIAGEDGVVRAGERPRIA